MLTRFLHIPTPPGSACGAPASSHRNVPQGHSGVSMGGGSFALPFLRTGMFFQNIPVFRSAYFPQRVRSTLCSKTLDLQVRFAHPPMPHRTSSSSCSGVPVGLFSDSAPTHLRCAGVPVGLFSDSAPTHLRCAGVPLGLFGRPKRLSSSRVRGLHQAIPYSLLQNARPPAASRPSVGGGRFAPPCTPLSHHPCTAGRSDSFVMSATTD